jgi:hypothetical protein
MINYNTSDIVAIALPQAATPENILSGFAATGLGHYGETPLKTHILPLLK